MKKRDQKKKSKNLLNTERRQKNSLPENIHVFPDQQPETRDQQPARINLFS